MLFSGAGHLGTLVHNSCVREVDPGKLRAATEKSDDVIGTINKLRKQIADYGVKRNWETKLYGIQDKFGNIKILNGTTRALRVNHFNRFFNERVPIEIEVTFDNAADFRRLWKISDFPSP